MQIKATPIKGKDLKPGDLFSSVGQEYWDFCLANHRSVGEKVYIRTDEPTPVGQEEEDIYLITILK